MYNFTLKILKIIWNNEHIRNFAIITYEEESLKKVRKYLYHFHKNKCWNKQSWILPCNKYYRNVYKRYVIKWTILIFNGRVALLSSSHTNLLFTVVPNKTVEARAQIWNIEKPEFEWKISRSTSLWQRWLGDKTTYLRSPWYILYKSSILDKTMTKFFFNLPIWIMFFLGRALTI